MKISSSDVAFASTHDAWQTLTSDTQLRAWADAGRNGNRSGGFSLDARAFTQVTLSENARTQLRQSQQRDGAAAATKDDVAQPDPATKSSDANQERDDALPTRLRLLKDIVEAMTGRRVRFITSADLQGTTPETATPPDKETPSSGTPDRSPRAGWGIQFSARNVQEDYERSTFSAKGSVILSSGQRIGFDLTLTLERYQRTETNVTVQAGDAPMKDPIVINLDGSALGTDGTSIKFDLTGDGSLARLPVLPGAGYLALDRNGNGRIDDGRELFGPRSGNGFDELRQLDADGNGWIDAADPAFAKLAVWRPEATGKGKLESLASAGIGALYLGNTATPYTLKDGRSAELGVVRSSGVYLKETGEAGSMQQIDVAA